LFLKFSLPKDNKTNFLLVFLRGQSRMAQSLNYLLDLEEIAREQDIQFNSVFWLKQIK